MAKRFTLVALCFLTWTFAGNADAKKKVDEIKIVAFGTSFTKGQGVSLNVAWPAKLEKLLKSDGLNVRILNQGVSGNTTRHLIARMDSDIPEGTQVVIFEYARGNDREGGITGRETVSNSDKIISRLVERNIQVLLVIRGRDQGILQRATNVFSRVVAKHGISYIAIEQPRSSLLPDGSHPTVKAHAEIAASMVSPVKQLIERARSGRK